MKNSTLILLIFSVMIVSTLKAQKSQKERIVQILTDSGNITIKLYNETPGHRDNFLKLAENGKFDGSIFHRVIKDFMIQGGDFAECNNTIPAEISTKFTHKKGALAAARQGDEVNPTKASSGCQFYIVQGRRDTENNIKMMEIRRNSPFVNSYFNKPENAAKKESLTKMQSERNYSGILQLYKEAYASLDKETAAKIFSYTPEQIKDFVNLGGTPHLDGSYTVFGEVIEGLEVVDKIASVQTNPSAKPFKDIKMTMKVLK